MKKNFKNNFIKKIIKNRFIENFKLCYDLYIS